MKRIFAIILLVAASALAQTQPTSAPATAPATIPAAAPTTTPATAPATQPDTQPAGTSSGPATRRVLNLPTEFKIAVIGGRNVLVTATEEPWMRKLLGQMGPATQPTTRPADLEQQLIAQRTTLVARMVSDLGLSDDKSAQELFDSSLLPLMGRMNQINPPVFYLPLSKDRLKQLLREGWTDPRLYYNRLADDVAYDDRIPLAVDKPIDDILIPIVWSAAASEREKSDLAQRIIHRTETSLSESIADQAKFLVQMGFIDFAMETVFRPMKLPMDQQWFSLGVSGILSCRYAAQATGLPQEELLRRLTGESPRVPVKMARVDLLHPLDVTVLRKQYAPFYVDACRRKSVLVIESWLKNAPADTLPKTVTAFIKARPADGPALVKLIQTTSGIDLTADLGPK